MRPIGYYVHHQGFGHFDRARLIARALRRPCTLIGTLPPGATNDIPVLRLPDDRLPEAANLPADACMPDAFHYAPLDFAPLRARMGLIADWVARHEPALMIVDVSVEIALFCRLLSVPVLVMRLAGDRSDPAHLEAFRASRKIIAPFPKTFEHDATPAWVQAKTFYAGFIQSNASNAVVDVRPDTVGVVLGSGGSTVDIAALVATARAMPARAWHVFGAMPASDHALPPNLTIHGFVETIDDAVAPMSVLVGAAGDGVLALAVRSGKRFVCIPEARPYDEQIAKAHVLRACGAAVVHEAWPRPDEWPAILEAAAALDTHAIAALRDDHSVARLAAMLETLASGAE